MLMVLWLLCSKPGWHWQKRGRPQVGKCLAAVWQLAAEHSYYATSRAMAPCKVAILWGWKLFPNGFRRTKATANKAVTKDMHKLYGSWITFPERETPVRFYVLHTALPLIYCYGLIDHTNQLCRCCWLRPHNIHKCLTHCRSSNADSDSHMTEPI